VINFLSRWQEAALTSIGFFWMALWAFALGYLISSMIQVLVTRARMQRTMGTSGPKSVALGTFFGFISSSCSFAEILFTFSQISVMGHCISKPDYLEYPSCIR
jgi:uncharacterized membrane protein YraQ (UPF0718 family)